MLQYFNFISYFNLFQFISIYIHYGQSQNYTSVQEAL